MSTGQAMGAASLAISTGTLKPAVRRALGKNVGNVVSGLNSDDMNSGDVKDVAGTAGSIAEEIKDKNAQKKVSDLAGSIAGSLDTVELSVDESDDVVNGLKDVGVKILTSNLPEVGSMKDGMSESGQSVGDADSRGMTIEEIRYEQRMSRLSERQNERRDIGNLLDMKNKTEGIEASLRKQVKKTSVGGTDIVSDAASMVQGAPSGANGSLAVGGSELSFGEDSSGDSDSDIQVQMDSAVVSNPDDERAKQIGNQMKISSSDTSGKVVGLMMGASNDQKSRRKRSIVQSVNKKRKRRSTNSTVSSGLTGVSEMSISSFKITTKGSAIVIVAQPVGNFDAVVIDAYLRINAEPTIENYDFHYKLPEDLDIWDMDEAYDNWKIFIDQETTKINSKKLYSQEKDMLLEGTDIWYLGLIQSSDDFDVSLTIETPSCRTQDPETFVWSGENCLVGDRSNLEHTQCKCAGRTDGKQLILGVEVFSPPQTIDFGSVFADFNFGENPAVIITICLFLGIYIFGLIVCTVKWDRQDVKKWKIRHLSDNLKFVGYGSHHRLYQVSIRTNAFPGSGTNGKVCLRFNPKEKLNMDTRPARLLRCKSGGWIEFDRGSTVHFIMRSVDISKCESLTVWHDNTDTSGWNIDKIVFRRLDTGKCHYFPVKRWLCTYKDTYGTSLTVQETIPDLLDPEINFRQAFKSNLWTKLFQEHLWVSVFFRNGRTNFSRTQAWSVCFLLLFISFVANCMWFETGQPGQILLEIGPIRMSPGQIWASIAAALVAIPPVTLIVFLFKSTRTAKEELQFRKEFRHRSPNYSFQNFNFLNYRFPYWCNYLWYLIAFIGMVCGAFFTILYSMQWGGPKSNRWLTNAMITFVQDILIMQPLKVAILSLFIAAIFRKFKKSNPNEIINEARNFEIQKALDYDIKKVKEKRKNGFKDFDDEEIIPVPKPLGRKAVQLAKWTAGKEKMMYHLGVDMVARVSYIAVLFLLCGLFRNLSQYNWATGTKTIYPRLIIDDPIRDINDFWRWLDDKALKTIYPEEDYTGERKQWRDRKFLKDGSSFRVGPVRLRQLRNSPERCTAGFVPEILDTGVITDGEVKFKPWSESAPCLQDTGDSHVAGSWYNGVLSEQDRNQVLDDKDIWGEAWLYQSAGILRGVPYAGELNSGYSGGGYSAELGVNEMTAKELIRRLVESAWLDGFTRSIFLEFTLYNPSLNSFQTVISVFEIPKFGGTGLVQSDLIRTYQVYPYNSNSATMALICQIIFILHFVKSVFNLLIQIATKRTSFFTESGWNILDIILVGIDCGVIACYLLRQMYAKATMAKFHEDEGRKFVNFAYNAVIADNLLLALGMAVFFGLVRLLKLLRFNQKVGLLSLILANAYENMKGVTVAFMLVMWSHCILVHNVFGNHLVHYKSIANTFMSLFLFLIGGTVDAKWDEYGVGAEIVGKLAFITFSITNIIFIVNLVVSIISADVDQSQADNLKLNKDDFELVGFVIGRVKTGVADLLRLPGKYKRKYGTVRNDDDAHQDLEDVVKRLDKKLEESDKRKKEKINERLKASQLKSSDFRVDGFDRNAVREWLDNEEEEEDDRSVDSDALCQKW